ncbi:hypothetical protein SASPL_119725 [Salvia splendens]|uniref:peptidylprolyl isomerase n=1 Tax=Salvia splendens TaxID=180675 RepID=A0A8X8ZTD1_SALSN|nr:hypothetical protein SASPL_119725 [Salvia splendens]
MVARVSRIKEKKNQGNGTLSPSSSTQAHLLLPLSLVFFDKETLLHEYDVVVLPLFIAIFGDLCPEIAFGGAEGAAELSSCCNYFIFNDLSAAGISLCEAAGAVSTSRRALRGAKVPESEFKTLPNGLKLRTRVYIDVNLNLGTSVSYDHSFNLYYDLKVGDGLEAVKGSRVAVHYVAKWKGITFMTSRQGMGVGGGTPYGFDVGQSERGAVLKGLDLGVEGMRVGGQRLLIVPPELAYGSKGVQEIPPNATIELDVELLAIKQNPFGSAVKIVEG